MSFNKGDIIEGTDRSKKAALHPIIFINYSDDGLILGSMLTHQKKLNIKFDDDHFEVKPESNKEGSSYFVNRILIKDNAWGPFERTGQLSQSGIEFLEGNISDKNPIWWEEAIAEIT